MQDINKIKENFIWALQADKKISQHTQQAYLTDLNYFIIFLKNENIELKENSPVQEEILEKFFLEIKKKYENATLERKMIVVVQFLKFLYYEEFKKDIVLKKPKIILNNLHSAFFSEEEFLKMKEYIKFEAKDLRLELITELLYSTGLRVSELLNLKINQVKEILNNKSLIVTGKGNKERYVFFNEDSLSALEKYLKKYSPDNFLFFNRNKTTQKPLSRQRIFQILKELAINCNIDTAKVYAHAFRHRMLTDLVKNGANLIAVQQIAGHENLSTTSKYVYTEDYLYKEIETFHPISIFKKKI